MILGMIESALQFLAGGDVAITAALIGGAFVIYQVWTGQQLHKKERRSTFLGYKASLPRLLSRMIAWCDELLDQIDAVHVQLQNKTLPNGATFPDWVELPIEAVDEFRALIRYSDDRRLIEQLFRIMQQIQVLEARLRSLSAEPGARSQTNIEVYMCNALEIIVRCESLFEFARLDERRPPRRPHWEKLAKKPLFRNLDTPRHIEFVGFVERRASINVRKDAGLIERSRTLIAKLRTDFINTKGTRNL